MTWTITQFLAHTNLTVSMSEGRRLASLGAIKVNGEVETDFTKQLLPGDKLTLRGVEYIIPTSDPLNIEVGDGVVTNAGSRYRIYNVVQDGREASGATGIWFDVEGFPEEDLRHDMGFLLPFENILAVVKKNGQNFAGPGRGDKAAQ